MSANIRCCLILYKRAALKGNKLFASKYGQLLKERICSTGRKFLPTRVVPNLEAILGRMFQVILGVLKHNFFLATPLGSLSQTTCNMLKFFSASFTIFQIQRWHENAPPRRSISPRFFYVELIYKNQKDYW